MQKTCQDFTESSAMLTDLIKDITPCEWTGKEKTRRGELKTKIGEAIVLGVPRLKGEIVFVSKRLQRRRRRDSLPMANSPY